MRLFDVFQIALQRPILSPSFHCSGVSPSTILCCPGQQSMSGEWRNAIETRRRVSWKPGSQPCPCTGYLGKLFGNVRIARYLGQHHGDIFRNCGQSPKARHWKIEFYPDASLNTAHRGFFPPKGILLGRSAPRLKSVIFALLFRSCPSVSKGIS